MGYFKDTLKGVTWMGAFRVAFRIIGIVRIAIIAHLLTPFTLGVFGIVTLPLSFLEILTETGINIFLIQEKDDIDKYISSAWVVSIVRGVIISILILLTAWPISKFFNSPESFRFMLLVSLVPFLRGFINPSIVKFQKSLEFNKEFIYRISVFLVESVLSVLGAVITKSPLGLVLGLIGGAVYEIFYTFFVVTPKPKFSYDLEKVRKVINRGKWVAVFGTFDYLYTTSDNILVGKMLGVQPLGIYQNAYKISTTPVTEVGDVFFKVTFPVFSKISGETKRLKDAFIKNVLVNMALIIPAGLIIYFLAEPIVMILLGKGWEGAIPVVRLLSILGVVRGISKSANSFLVARQKQKYVALVIALSTLGLLVSIVPLINRYGIIGAGIAAIIGALVSLPLNIYLVFKTLKMNG